MTSSPHVSVVVPTLSRPALVTRAIHGALTQTVEEIEVIVVVDGPDDETQAVLKEIDDRRLRVIGLPERGGAPNARNVGVQAARAPWIALLDDDDEWLPHKLAVQLEQAAGMNVAMPVVASRLINRTPRADLVLPRRLPEPEEPISEYLTVRRGLFHGDGFIQTSTILAPTELLRRVPFAVDLRRLQELDWIIRVATYDDVQVVVADEALVVWYTDEDRPRQSFDSPWEQMLDWLRESRPRLTRRAYAALTMSVLSAMAAPTHSPRVFWTLLREAHRHGRPSALDYVAFLQIWLIPPGLRRGLRDLILGRRRQRDPAPVVDAAAPAAPRVGAV